MLTDIFKKKAPEATRKRAWIRINLTLAEHYVCREELLEARVALLCKDHGNLTLLTNNRQIALCNAFYQFINIIMTSKLRRPTKKICCAGVFPAWVQKFLLCAAGYPERKLAPQTSHGTRH